MFDDQPIGNSADGTPTNLPIGEPEDIFSDTTDTPPVRRNISIESVPTPTPTPSAISAGVLTPKREVSPTPISETQTTPQKINQRPIRAMPVGAGMDEHKITGPSVLKSFILMMVIALLVGAVVYAGWYAYSNYFRNSDVVAPVTQDTPPTIPEASKLDEVEGEVDTSFSDTVLFGDVVDTDGDTIEDTREETIGTDPLKSDTDGDGLSDGDEINIWKTNPLNPDTDGDGYTDGSEVANGYNPLGLGTLIEASLQPLPTPLERVDTGATNNPSLNYANPTNVTKLTNSNSIAASNSNPVSAPNCTTNEECFLYAVDSCLEADIAYSYRDDMDVSLGVTRVDNFVLSISRDVALTNCQIGVLLKTVDLTFTNNSVNPTTQTEIMRAEKLREGRTASCSISKEEMRLAVKSSQNTNLVTAIFDKGVCRGVLIGN